MADAKRDANRVATLLGVSNADGLTPLQAYIDSSTNRLLVNGLISGTVNVDKTPYAVKITTSGTSTYVGKATEGTVQSSATWQAKKIAVSGSDTIITWADGNSNFDNVATDLTALSYS